MVLVGLIALLTSCCIAKTSEDEIKASLWSDGEAQSQNKSEELAACALSLLESADDTVHLIASPDLIDSIKATGPALEIVWADTLIVTLPSGIKDRVTRVLLPLAGEYGPQEDNASVLILYGTKSYVTPPLMNNSAQAELKKIRELLKW